MIHSKQMDTGNFQMALKQEIEELGNLQRRQNFENLSIMKNLTSTCKHLKENYRYFKENDN